MLAHGSIVYTRDECFSRHTWHTGKIDNIFCLDKGLLIGRVIRDRSTLRGKSRLEGETAGL